MKLKFDANYDYQLDAIQSVVDLFDGQQTTSGANIFEVSPLGMFRGEKGIGNLMHIDEHDIFKNIQKIQRRNNIIAEEEYAGNHFSIEMETGTGKTYVYLRTIFELHKTYGFSKFVIVVPSIAIREGVLKSLEITKEHFKKLYGNTEYQYFVYNSKKPTRLRNFAISNQLCVMVINIDAFNKQQNNIIHLPNDTIGGIPIEFVQHTNPFVIMDEPQNMESQNAKNAIESLNPLCTLRYSATHRNLYNQLYCLSPVDAYDKGLVKRIEVASVAEEGSQNDAYIKLKEIKAGKRSINAKIEIECVEKGEIKKKTISISSNTTCDLYTKSNGIPAYDGYVVSSLDARSKIIEFSNGESISINETTGELKDAIMYQQIEETIREHFDKALKLQKQHIKVLSLFFIDTVANYRDHENNNPGKFAVWFEKIYEQYRTKQKYHSLDMPKAEDSHDGYFSKDSKGKLKDTNGETKADKDTYALIMKDKERLLSLDEPLQFIFSHSALREGWDNPNVFQICTLNASNSIMKKRQEIGRGLRLAVNQFGERIFDHAVNILTVIANESYDNFARSLQNEIEAETGVSFGNGRIKNRRKRKSASLKKNWNIDPKFEALWKRINKRTRYNVSLDVEAFTKKAVEAISNISVLPPRIRTEVAELNFDIQKGILTTMRSGKDSVIFEQSLPVPDVLGYISNFTNLKYKTILHILNEANVYKKIRTNPQLAMDSIVKELRSILQAMMVDGIKYEKIAGAEYEMTLFESKEIESYIDNMFAVSEQEKTLYDFVVYDSDIEKSFVKELEARDEVKFYMKLPTWFKVDTPLGNYNPDWAIIFENDKRLYLIAETKGVNRLDELKPEEAQKIKASKKHFEAIGDVSIISPVTNLRDVTNKLQG